MDPKVVGVIALGVALLVFWYYRADAPTTEVVIDAGATPASKEESPAPIVSSQPQPSEKQSSASPAAAPPISSASTRFCPKFGSGAELGRKDGPVPAGQRGDVANLQYFLSGHYGLGDVFTAGTFDEKVEQELKRYQGDVGISQTGVLDSESMRVMLAACVDGVKANGVEFATKNFTLSVGSVTLPLNARESLVENTGEVKNGAVRIELISVTPGAQLRVTGPAVGGLQSQRFTLQEGEELRTSHSPAITVKVVDIRSSSAELTISR